MSRELEHAYRRLLSCYPRAWRLKNEEVVLGTLLDEAEAEGRSKPSLDQRVSLIAHGAAERISLKTGVVLSMIAMVLALLGAGMMLASPALHPVAGQLVLFLGFGLPGLLVVVALCGLLRNLGWIGHVRSLVVPALAVPAFVAGVLALGSWSQGFVEADAELPASGFADLFPVFALSGLAFGTLSSAVLLQGALDKTIRNAPGRRLVSGAIGVGVAISAGVSLMVPGAVLLLALVIMAASIWAGNVQAVRGLPASMAGETILPDGSEGLVGNSAASATSSAATRQLAGLSAALGSLAVVFSLTGSLWPGVNMDATQSMRFGLMSGYLAGIPLAVALAARVGEKGAAAQRGPLVLIVAAMLVSAAEYGFGNGSGDLETMLPLGVSALLAAAACGWAGNTWWKNRGNNHFGAFGPVVLGLGFLFTVGLPWATMAPFVLPVLATLVAWRPWKRRGSPWLAANN